MADNPNAAFKVIWTYEGEKNTYELEVPTTETWGDLKARIQELTLVKPDLQKLIGIKGGKAPADDAILSTLPLKTPVQKLMLLGTPEAALFVDPANLPYAHLLDLFGANLIRNVQGETISTGDLEGKHVFIYFSAHWCPPCRAFTPELIAFYNRHHEDKNFELVFVSSDRDQGAFNEYFGSMPWVAVAYNDVDVKNALSAKFRVRGIPTLVLLDPSGVTITTKAREAVSQDPTAEGFPWQDGGQLALAPAGLEDPVWRTQFFLGAFGDACLAGMPGIGGEATGPLQVLLHVLDSEVVGSGRYPLENEEVGAIRAGLTLLAQTVELHDGISRVRDGYEKPEDILPVLNALMQMLDAIEVGSMLVLPGGWFAPGKLHCLMHIVERVGPNEFSFVVCNSSDTEGLAYHPSQADSSSNIVYKASLKIDGISRDRMLDAAFWAMFVKMQVAQLDANRAEVLYDVLIPWLTQQELPLTIVESDPDDAATFSAAQNAPLSHYRCVMEVTRYMFRKLGLADDQIHRIFFAVRSELISMTLNDVGATQLIHHAERAVVRMGCKALAADAVEEFNERGLGVDRLQAIFETIDKIEARLAVIRTFGDQLGSLPPSVAMGTSAPMKPYPYFRHFKEVGEDQYAGKQTAEPVMPPIDFLSPTHEVATFPDALRAALQCRALCKKLIEHARSGLSGALPRQYEIIITINHCLTEVLPLPSPEESHEPCFYAHAMPAPNRDQQVKFLTAIYELANIYGAAWQSLKRPTRSMDSERALVGGCMMAIFDAAARIMASDHPLLLSILLEQNGGQKICTTVGLQPQMSFEALAKTMQFDYSPKLNGARSKVLAYFDSVDRKNEKVLFNWWMDAGSHTLQVQRMSPTMAFVRTYLSRLGLPLSDNMMETEMQALCRWCFNDLPGESPEFGMLRDMVCIFKFLATMETEEADMKYRRRVIHRQDQRWFLQYEGDWARDRIDALSGLSFEVQGMNVDQTTAFVLMAGFGRPALIYGAGPVACSPASPETHLKMSHPTEDDVLHCRHLPTFGESISEEDSEELMSYLTAEYVRVPMVSNFFASQHRLSYLFVEELRDILRASIFESGSWVAPWNEDPIDSIPARRVIWERDPLGCSKGLLLNEMEHSPGSTLEPIVRMIESVSEIPVTSVFSLNATLYLFTMEVALGVEAYILEALAEPETLDEARETLVAYRARILRFLRVIAERRLTAWMAEAEADDNMPTLCMCHAYMALLWRNTPVEEMSVEAASKMIGHTAFVSHWHEFGNYPKAQADEGELETFERLRRFLGAHGIPTNRLTSSSLPGISGSLERILVLVIGRQSVRIDLRKYDPEVRPPPADVPEYELFEMLQNQRRAILEYMQALVQQSELDTVLSEIVRVALRGERGQIQGWSEVAGPRPGSFSAHDADVIVDIQTAEIQYRNNALRALPQSIYDFADFRNVFGDEAFHCGLVARQEHRLWLRLVGVSVDLMEWDTPDIADQGIGQPRDRSRPRAPPGGAGASSGASGGGAGGGFNPNGDPTWTCNVCESINVDATRDRCELCEAWRPGRAPATAINPAAGDELGPGFEYGGSNYTRTYPSGEDSEEWIENIIRPVLQVNPNEDAVIYMTEEVTPAAASTATLISFVIDKQTSQITWKVFVAHRHFEVLHVYDLVSHGRRMYRTLVYTSNAPLALHNLQVNVQSKKRVVPDAVRFQEGAVWRNGHIGTSLVIARNNPVIRGRETFIPSSIIRGLIPSVILDNYRLWQGEDQILRGYPLDTGSPYFDTPIEITLSEGDNGDWAATVTKRRPGAKLRRIVQGAASGPDHIDVTAAAANGGAGTSTTAETSEDGDGDGDEAVTRAEKPANDVDPELLGAVRALGIDEDVARLALLASATGSADAFEDQLNAAVNWVYDPANANDVENASEILRQNAPGLSMPRSGSTLEQFNTLLEYDFDPVVIEHALKLYPGNMELALAWILDEANQADILSLRNTGSLPEAPTGGITGSGVSAVGQIIGTTPTPGPAEEEGTLTLLNLMYTDAPPDSLLHRVATIMARVEDLSHVLVWTTSSAFTALTGGACNISVIALPRLGMRFQPRTDKQGVVRLYSLDQAGWWVSDAATIDALETPGNGSLNNLLAGIPHNLVLENENSELMVMVPNCDIHRLNIIQFSTEVLLDRAAASWLSKVSTRCYFYRVHTTRTFLMADSVASTLYLVLLRLAARQYDAVFRLSETCQVDVNFTAEEARAFGLLQRLADDQTPDAHACRLKLSLGVLLGNNELPWELAAEYDGYVKKLKHVSAGCRLEEDEELEVIRKIEEEISTVANNRLRVLQAVRAGLPTAEQQGRVLKRGGDPWRLALTKPPLLGGVHHSSLSNVYYAAPRDQMIRDGELAGLMQRLETDEESGSSGKVGFLGLYDLLSPTGMLRCELLGRDVSRSFAELQTRLFQLRNCNWGGNEGVRGDAVTSVTYHTAQLALYSAFPHGYWPEVPHAGLVQSQLRRGVELANTDPENQPALQASEEIRFFFTMLHSRLEGLVTSDEYAVLQARLDQEHQMMHDICEPRISIVDVVLPSAHCVFPTVSNMACDSRRLEPFESDYISLGPDEIAWLADRPLDCLGLDNYIVEEEVEDVPFEQVPFNLHGHPAAGSYVAKKILERLDNDVTKYREMVVGGKTKRPKFLSTAQVASYIDNPTHADIGHAIVMLDDLVAQLLAQRESDRAFIEVAAAAVVEKANTVSLDDTEGAAYDERLKFVLSRYQGTRADLILDYVTCCLLSTNAVADLQLINPYLDGATANEVLTATQVLLFRTARVSHINRVLKGARSVQDQLRRLRTLRGDRSSFINRLHYEVQSFANALATKRYYGELDGDALVYDPRFLVFEYIFDIILRRRQVEMVNQFVDAARSDKGAMVQQMIMGAGKTTVIGPLLALILADGERLVMEVVPSALLEMSRNVMRSRFTAIVPKRVYTFVYERSEPDNAVNVNDLHAKLDMARRKRAVVCTTPDSVKSLMLKYVEQCHSIERYNVLAGTGGDGAAGPSTPTASTAATATREDTTTMQQLGKMILRSDASDALVAIMDMWQAGVLMMDEVDVLLHPLKSELNYPIGEKEPIDLEGNRWDLPIHLLDGIFYYKNRELWETVPPEVEDLVGLRAENVLNGLREAILQGFDCHALLQVPHLALLQPAYYHERMKTLCAQWALFWLRQNFIGRVDVSNDDLVGYLTGSIEGEDKVRIAAGLIPSSVKLLNLATDWLDSLLPHCLSKINRVTYGILTPQDVAMCDPRMPQSRRLLAVPFVGKDVPSRSSEFAHPDVLLGLSILAYRRDGVRKSDLKRVVEQLKKDFGRDVGPPDQRRASILFQSWLEGAQERIKRALQMNYALTPTSPKSFDFDAGAIASSAASGSGALSPRDEPELGVFPLSLFQPNDPQQLQRLYRIIKRHPPFIHYYLRQHVFPACMNFQQLKVSASGQELGSNILFGRRLGFSGTPSNLMPADLGECQYEAGSDGRIINVLTSPLVVSSEVKPTDWKATSILQDVATSDPPFHALIDTGALITGMDNEEVARYLLRYLPEWMEGVVFLDRQDKQQIILRAGGPPVLLNQCGVSLDKRFTFYDQVHTTGMDIKQAPNARAALTIGKDMTFRDYAQGAFRMRGIAIGQTIHLQVIPEVANRIREDLEPIRAAAGAGVGRSLEIDVAAWLLINSMRMESLQFIQLCIQELHTVWRKRAFHMLTGDSRDNVRDGSEVRLRRFLGDGDEATHLRACIQKFREEVSYVVADEVPELRGFDAVLADLVEENAHLMQEDGATEMVDFVRERAQQASRATAAEMLQKGRTKLDAEVVNENETEVQQEQQREKDVEKQKEREIAYSRDDEAQNPWLTDLLLLPPERHPEGQSPFYAMNTFRIHTSHFAIDFPATTLVSDNFFRPSWVGVGERRLKNVHLILVWMPDRSKPADKYVVLLSLAEAQTIHRMIHRGRDFFEHAGIALVTQEGQVINSVMGAECASDGPTIMGLQCMRFVNNAMFYTEDELHLLRTGLMDVREADRQAFFETCLRYRRRERLMWMDTPIAKVFTEEDDWGLLKARALVQQVSQALLERRLKLDQAFERFDVNQDGLLSKDELMRAFTYLDLGFSSADLVEIVRLADTNADGNVDFHDFSTTFRGYEGPDIDEDNNEAQDQAASRIISTWRCPGCAMVCSSDQVQCLDCGRSRFEDPALRATTWTCAFCTMINARSKHYCPMCMHGRVIEEDAYN